MKHMKKFVSVLLALVMVLAMTVTAFAAEGGDTESTGNTESTGSITIQKSTNVPVVNKTFNAYKILDLQMVGESGYVYTVPEVLKGFYAEEFELNANAGNFSYQVTQKIEGLKADVDKLFAFASDALAAAKAAGITPGTGTGEEGKDSVTISNLPFGYYVVEDAGTEKPISALMLNTVEKDITITIKADKPTVDKNIVEGTNPVKNNNAAVGDEVPYKVTSKVPDMTGYKTYFFVLKDTLSAGLTFNDDVVITVGEGEPLTRVYPQKETDPDTGKEVVKYYTDENHTTLADDPTANKYTLTYVKDVADKIVSFEIVFVNFIQYKDQTGNDITVTYSATLNEDAEIGTAGNDNTVNLTYSNDPTTNSDGDPDNPDKPDSDDPTGITPDSKTTTFVTGVKLIKVDPEGNTLTGAKFEIQGDKTNIVLVTGEVYVQDNESGTYWLLKDGTYTTDDPSTPNMDTDKYADTVNKYSRKTETTPITTNESVKATAFVGEDGTLQFEGLSEGEYTITELIAPNGYNLLDNPINVKIEWKAPEGNATACTWTYTWTQNDETLDAETDAANTIKVENVAGSILPTTGGIGTTIFYVLGSILLVGAAIMLIVRRRMSAAN